jgi:6-phosphogluconolactonase/glucosamine-6-phosphate isomerase/deaminase
MGELKRILAESQAVVVQALVVLLAKRLEWAQVAIGQFGIGADYHTGGILPDSPAARETEKLAITYEQDGSKKITITPATIKRLNLAFINSMGESKRNIIQHFRESQAAVQDEPAQALKSAKRTYLYSDVL